MTFWQYVDQIKDAETSPARAAEIVANLHRELREFPQELPFLDSFFPFFDESFAMLESRGDLLDRADWERGMREWQAVRPLVAGEQAFLDAFPDASVQPVHGDSPTYNLIVTPQGELCSDFELVTRGPIELDLAFVGPEGEQAYNALAPKPLNERLLRFMEAIRMLQVVACYAQVPDMPSLGEGMRPALDAWRSMPPAYDLI